MRFTIIITSLNAGEKLHKTVESALNQSFDDFEILIKDGLSKDGSINELNEKDYKDASGRSISELITDNKIRIVSKGDKSIYDGMNQATKLSKGEYYIFLNCGDVFENNEVLSELEKIIANDEKKNNKSDIYYGDMRRLGVNEVIPSPREITDFVCYRNIPCHQVCFYNRRLFEKRGYDTNYPIRADYEHFLWCKYRDNATYKYVPLIVSIYEGGGYSETKENEKKAIKEHKKITSMYLGKKCILYRLIMILTLQKLRKKMAESEKMSGIYQKIKGAVYGKK